MAEQRDHETKRITDASFTVRRSAEQGNTIKNVNYAVFSPGVSMLAFKADF